LLQQIEQAVKHLLCGSKLLFLIRKTYDIKWTTSEGNSNYEYFTKTWHSAKNPITIDLPKEKTLAEKLG